MAQHVKTADRIEHTLAAVWRGGADICVESVAVPPLGPGDVLARVRLATVCGSDRHTVSGRRSQPCPSILGHETVGEIVSLGAEPPRAVDGRVLRVGQRVIWCVTLPCGACDRCLTGVTAKCRIVRKAGHEALDSEWGLSGGYAQHVLLPRGLAIAVVDDDLNDSLAAPAACATATVMAVAERAGSLAGQRVVVVGAGMLGLTAIAAAVCAGASAVTAVDPVAGRRELARRFGAYDARDSARDAGPFDVLLDFSGAPAALEDGLGTLDVQGVAVLAGAVAPNVAVAVDAESVVRRQLSIFGIHNYEPRHLTAALSFLRRARERFPWSELVADPGTLDDLGALLTAPAGPVPRYSIAPWAVGHTDLGLPPQSRG
ncbi:alcohol dehydrogenase catalytic domain-containing protein [Mycobacterium sp. 1465703.0]|uniref:alcohol dehydrogenase catalytic domain-containing protein n=1 Tax=Mycobacterium sp. 1465703.0 TaxID=1834078 RepID=UPI0007FE32FF|nr:alcohol dehydrogenase catalytic domain-containing protein [Mycobacterium sp. 1465703.0]OBI97315.1 dehydrogenase [Mycobacterium sp. 1465703.0]